MRYPNRGKPPRDKSVKLGIKFANGEESKHTFTADQLRWSITGDGWDISEFWRA